MRRFRYILFLFMVLSGLMPSAHADTWRASLLTCAPGENIYELYGHTAIRLRNSATGEDWVFNYGMFSFNKPHFIWRFILGQTDYELGVAPYGFFAQSYWEDGRSIDEQVLNLRDEEAGRLYELLMDNYRPENRSYRYNFLYDNCTTRAIDRIAACVDGRIVFPEPGEKRTFRDIIHEFSADSPWDRLGQDLLIGAEVDKPIALEQQLFAPLYAERYVGEAYVERTDGSREPLAQKAEKIVDAPTLPSKPATPGPWTVTALIVLAAAIMIFAEWKRRHPLWGFDLAQLLLQGSLGCIIGLLFFFSEHPAVGSNWLIILFNPLYLAAIPLYFMAKRRKKLGSYYAVQTCVAVLFICVGLAGAQCFPAEIWTLALILLSQSVTGYWLVKLQHKRNRQPEHGSR